MTFPVLFAIYAFVVVLVLAQRRSARGGLRGRVPARGLILQASSIATETTIGGQRFELRQLLLDVEVAGREPYEVSCTPAIPRICEALPGAALDLRVDPSNRSNVEIVGPLGASAWLPAATGLPGQALWPGAQRGGLPRGCGLLVVVIVGLVLAFGTVVSILDARSSDGFGGQAAKSEPSPAPAPAQTSCAMAYACCQVLGRTGCNAFLSRTASSCDKTLLEERSAAAAAHKRCP